MAIVKNKAQQGALTDPSFCSPNRTNAGSPAGTITPQYAGEIIMDTTNNVRWKAHGVGSNSWTPMEAEVTA